MTATVLRTAGERSIATRVWAWISSFLAQTAEIDRRNGSVEPFGL
ncbi:hypothetical protein [Hyphomicrobium sp.]|nr:hypothetical protein [Hyphomicrobium sp.]HET6390393.1 hypothetical protein [Hyphomicrobium sp.]